MRRERFKIVILNFFEHVSPHVQLKQVNSFTSYYDMKPQMYSKISFLKKNLFIFIFCFPIHNFGISFISRYDLVSTNSKCLIIYLFYN